MLTRVVGGGGFRGVELATALIDYFSRLCKQFEIAPNDTQLIVIEGGNTVLSGFDLELIYWTQARAQILTQTFIWTGGVRACDLVAEAGLKYGPRSRVVVNPYLESIDHPEVYVIGDNALVIDPVTNRPLAPTAQLALQQAEVAAINIFKEIKGARRGRYFPKVSGQFVSLDDRNAVG